MVRVNGREQSNTKNRKKNYDDFIQLVANEVEDSLDLYLSSLK